MADKVFLEVRSLSSAGWGYTVFGKVVEGMDVVDQIGHTATGRAGEFDRNVPVDPIVIERMILLQD